jgi:hypothetical protein
MSAKKVCLATLVTALVGLGAVRGQYTPTSPGALGGMSPPPSTSSALTTRPGDATPPQDEIPPGSATPVNLCLSDWIVGTKPGCCGPVGANGPVQMEIYLQSGLAFPFSDGVWGHTLHNPGWDIQGGGRSLFFDAEEDAAWVIDLSLSNTHYHGRNPSYEVPLQHIFQPVNPTQTAPAAEIIVNYVPRHILNNLAKANGQPTNGQPVTLKPAGTAGAPAVIAAEGVSIADLNTTFANLGFGRDWYLRGQAPTYLTCAACGDHDCDRGNWVWRVGVDGGGRYGTAKLELHEVRHRTDTIAGLYVGAHSDIEVPCGCCIFQAGIRLEYDYTWMDILQKQNDTDLQNLNLLFTIGTRF